MVEYRSPKPGVGGSSSLHSCQRNSPVSGLSGPAHAESAPLLAIRSHRATITLNRPSKANKLTAGDLSALFEHFERIDADPSIRAVVLAATGRVFSAGFDLDDISGRLAGAPSAQSAPTFEAVCDRLERLAAPTVCALNGGVYGGATDLALACDFRIAVDSADLCVPAGRLGIHYYPGGLRRFVSRLGLAAAKRLFLTAERIHAAEMLSLGYVDELVPADELEARVAALAEKLAANAPRAVQGMKRALNEIARGDFDEAAARRRHAESLTGEELREGLAAYRERRAPRF